MNEQGKINKNYYNKFKQINKYLEFFEDTLNEMQTKKLLNKKISILDFGCGKSYLTFALYYYLKNFKNNLDFEIIGLDLKKEVIENCNQLAKKLNYENLYFLNEDIKNFKNKNEVDIVFSLHACNNATDFSILKALELNAKAILSVPCCHHEFFEKISKNKNSEVFSKLNTMLSNGVTLDKFSTIATDSFRSLALELCGYKSKILEFIDMEHTPKNILIKSIKTNYNRFELEKKYLEYNNFKKFLGIEPMLEKLIEKFYLIK